MAGRSKVRPWHSKKTKETEMIEKALRTKFPNTDAYRYNSASIRVRIMDGSFEGLTESERDAMVDPILDQLPETTQSDIMLVLTMTPKEAKSKLSRYSLLNLEFENPLPSRL
jgi:hypothetical protein